MWTDIIYNNNDLPVNNAPADREKYKKFFTNTIAEGLYNDLRRSVDPNLNFAASDKDFEDLTKAEKNFWLSYASEIPDKFKAINLFIRPFRDFCRTCLITDNEIATFVRFDLEKHLNNTEQAGLKSKHFIDKKPFPQINKDINLFFLEINYLIPLQLKKIGYEPIRHEEAAEINLLMVKKLARAMHSGYLNEIRNQGTRADHFFYTPEDSPNMYLSDFDDLPEEIKNSNLDNAAHIPTKLLSIGYKIRVVEKGYKPFALHLDEAEIETMAIVEHLRWSWEKRLNGWIPGSVKDSVKKTHPGLIPYQELSESEKEKDRQLVKLIPALLQDIKFEAYPVSPNRISKLSYAIKPQSSIHKILDETRKLNNQIRKLVTLTPDIEEIVAIRNKMIEEAINEVEENYNYAQHIQKTYLPDDHAVRECFTDSFILFKPKDIVSGDFYFFSKQRDLIIFAAADCTGHGIPGALLSTLGYGILDQAVNEIKLTDPSLILHHLYPKIHRFLRNDEAGAGLSDDLDIILCTLDTRTNLLTYAGVKNPLYCITNSELMEYRAKNFPEKCIEGADCKFTSEQIQLNPGDTIYLCSDGYADQFGGKNHKKYQTGKLKDFLLGINESPMPEQCDKLYEEITMWMEENDEDQTDDILIIGIRL